MLRPRSFVAVALAGWLSLLLGGGGCSPSAQAGAPSATPEVHPIDIVTTTAILADWARQVAGEGAQVQSLLRPGGDPHTFNPSPGEMAALAEADLILLNGLGMEHWAEAFLAEAAAAQVVYLGEMVDPIAAEEERDLGVWDPHFWLDPSRVVMAVEAIRDALLLANPARSETYSENAAAYIAQLQELHASIQQKITTLPPERRLLATNHDSFRYFALRYGFEIVGTVIPGVTTEREPSARELAELVETIRKAGAPAVFLESTGNPKLAQSLAREAGIRVVNSLYIGALGPPGRNADNYIAMMQHNVRTIVEALR